MNTIPLNYEILKDTENERIRLRLFFDEFKSEEDKPINLSCKVNFTEELIYQDNSQLALLFIERTQDALERCLVQYNLKAQRLSVEESEKIYLEIKSSYEKFN